MTTTSRQPFDLATELVDILMHATAAMRVGSLSRILHVTGIVDSKGDAIRVEEIDLALEGLVTGGQVERRWRGGVPSYRPMRSEMVGQRNPRAPVTSPPRSGEHIQ